MNNTPGLKRERLSRRDFAGSAMGAGAMLALAPPFDGAISRPGAISRHRQVRTLFFNFSHEDYAGHTYYLVIGQRGHALSPPLSGPSGARKSAPHQ